MSKFVFAFCSLLYSLAYTQVNDASLWTELEIQKKINLRQAIGISENLRLIENYSQVSTHFTELSYQYKFTKQFEGTISYRFAQRFKYDQSLSFRNRLTLDLNYKFKFKTISISFRERLQHQYQDAFRTNWTDNTTTFRSRITCDFDLEKRFEPFVSGEVFLENFNFLNNIRFAVGCKYEFSKQLSAQLSFIMNKELQVRNPYTFFIVAPSLKYCF